MKTLHKYLITKNSHIKNNDKKFLILIQSDNISIIGKREDLYDIPHIDDYIVLPKRPTHQGNQDAFQAKYWDVYYVKQTRSWDWCHVSPQVQTPKDIEKMVDRVAMYTGAYEDKYWTNEVDLKSLQGRY